MNKRWTAGAQDATDAAFFARNFPPPPPPSSQTPTRGRGRGARGFKSNRGGRNHPYFQCSYCQKAWHNIDTCRKRIHDEEVKKKFFAAKSATDQDKTKITEEVDHGFIYTSMWCTPDAILIGSLILVPHSTCQIRSLSLLTLFQLSQTLGMLPG